MDHQEDCPTLPTSTETTQDAVTDDHQQQADPTQQTVGDHAPQPPDQQEPTDERPRREQHPPMTFSYNHLGETIMAAHTPSLNGHPRVSTPTTLDNACPAAACTLEEPKITMVQTLHVCATSPLSYNTLDEPTPAARIGCPTNSSIDVSTNGPDERPARTNEPVPPPTHEPILPPNHGPVPPPDHGPVNHLETGQSRNQLTNQSYNPTTYLSFHQPMDPSSHLATNQPCAQPMNQSCHLHMPADLPEKQ
ncbi:mucin-2-like [Acanthaster planci]|uniref:Mucin-2-like n=1 Tax=Acanthaster planci TaxID=133434 RepID=A0A8B7ZXU7_ACAPL|nr:mucin-2-like [Acanthaster planci]